MNTIPTPNGDEIGIEPGEALYRVEGAGADQYLTAASPELAAQEAAEWQHGDDGRVEVRVEWRGTGPGSAVAEYDVWVDGTLARRVVVYEEATRGASAGEEMTMTTNKVTVTVRDCTVEIEPHDGGVHVHEIGRTPTDGSERYESAFHVDPDGGALGQGFVGKVSEDEQSAIDEALRDAVARARARWPEVEAAFAARDRVRARG